MELAGFKVGVVLDFHHFYELAVGRCAGDFQARLFQGDAEFAVVVEFVAVTMAFANLFALVELGSVGILHELARVSAEAHGAALFGDVLLFVHQVDDRVGCLFVEFRGVGVLPAEYVACKFNHAALHAETNSQQRNLVFAGILDGDALAVYAAASETSRNQNAVRILDEARILFKLFGLDAFHFHLGVVFHAGMLQGFVHGLVSVADGDVLAHQRDGAFVLGLGGLLDELVPFGVDNRVHAQAELFQHAEVKFLLGKFAGHGVHRISHILFFDDAFGFYVAEERELVQMILRDCHFGTAHENVREDTDIAELGNRVLRRLCLEFACGLQVRHQNQVDKAGVFHADFKTELSCGFEEWERFNVACDTADFAEHDVSAAFGCRAEGVLDFVGNVRNYLHGAAEVLARAFFCEHGGIDATRSVARCLGALHACETFVVAQIKVGFVAVVCHENFAVLVRTHGARVYVQVRVQFLHEHLVAAALEKERQRCGGDSLTEGADHAAGNENVLGLFFCGSFRGGHFLPLWGLQRAWGC